MSTTNTQVTLAAALGAALMVEISTVRQVIGGHFVSPAEVAAMRDWLSDCAVELCHTGEEAEENLARVALATPRQIVRWVGRSYSGGVAAFLGDGPCDMGPVVEVEQGAE